MSADVLKFLPVVQYYIISLWNMTSGICLATPWNIAPHFALKASSDLHCDLLYKWFSATVTNSIGFPLESIKDVDVNKHASTQLKTGFWWVTCHCDNFKLHCRYTSYGTFWNTFNRAQPKNKIYLQSNRKWSMTETFFFMHRKTCIITLSILQVCHPGDCSVFTCKLISFALTFTWWLRLETPNYLIRVM